MKYPSIRKVLGDNIKYYRFKIGYTQEKLAELTDLSPRYISDIENYNGNISVDTLENIARCLKVEYYLLLKESHHKPLPKRVNLKRLLFFC